MPDLLISLRAEIQLRQIWRYVAADNPAAANRILLRIDERLQILRRFPRIGPVRNDLRSGLRMLVEGNYLLLYEYRSSADQVEVIAVLDGRRDLSGLI